ncbi:MAG: AAA family ATPase, partial [Candidatus Gastranaerophilales bacterium]|nr:AAA family ATPase [Candidatus Gastranaerophilales bacterium]
MIKNFSIENFKGYFGRYDFEFPGLTYLTGANNSGKSSVIQALYMIASSNSNNFEPSLLLNTPNYAFGSFSDILNKNCSNKENINFELNFDDFYILLKYENNEIENYNPILKELQVEFIDKNKKTKNYVFERVVQKDPEKNRFFNWFNLTKTGKLQKQGNAVVMGFSPEIIPKNIKDINLEDMIHFRYSFAKLQTNTIKYLKAYRIEGKPSYLIKGSSITDIGITGDATAEAIYKMMQGNRTVKFGEKESFSEIFQRWFKRIIGENYSLAVESHEGTLKIKIEEDLQKQQRYSITEVGFGFSQIIPIIAMILLSEENDVLLIENPEVHLHPKLQANLADLFVFAIKHNRKLIIETHSEHIIN